MYTQKKEAVSNSLFHNKHFCYSSIPKRIAFSSGV